MLFSLDRICYAWPANRASAPVSPPVAAADSSVSSGLPPSDVASSGAISSGTTSSGTTSSGNACSGAASSGTTSFGNGSGLLLDSASLTLSLGERLAITGDNGVGKSTLLHIGAGLLRPLSGQVSIMGQVCRTEKEFSKARQHVGYLLQRAEDQLFCPTVLEDVAFGPYNYGASRAEAAAKARSTLAMLGLLPLADRNGSRLSGGEGKLAALAAVLATDPQFLFLDEPTNDLDSRARTRLLDLLDRISLPFVLVSHDSEFVQAVATRTCRLHEGRLW